MTVLSLLPPVLSLLVLGAHFYRAGQPALVLLMAALAALVFVKRPWAARAIQAALLLGAVEWVRTALRFIEIRQDLGRPWIRLALILAAVTLLTALSALVFETRRMSARFGLGGPTPER